MALDLDTGARRLGEGVELFDFDPGPGHPPVRHAEVADQIGEGFHQIDMPGLDDRLDPGDEMVVVDDVGDAEIGRASRRERV